MRKTTTLLAALLVLTILNVKAQLVSVTASYETEPITHFGDLADDPAIWVHPNDPDSSLFIGTDKSYDDGRLEVYDMDGNRVFHTPNGTHFNNVDMRYNFPFNGELIDIVAASNLTEDGISIYRIVPETRKLEDITGDLFMGVTPYGMALYHDPDDGKFYAFASKNKFYATGAIYQYEIYDNGNNMVDGTLVRTLHLGTTVEGMVADDETGAFYVGEELVGIWEYDASPDGGSSRYLIDGTSGPNLTADVEGLTIYYAANGEGYILASSQGNSTFAVYDRNGDHQYRGSFEIVDGTIGGTSYTDGIDVLSFPLGSNYPNGVFIAHNSPLGNEIANFKMVTWEDIANELNLIVDTSMDPRNYGSGPVENTLLSVRVFLEGAYDNGMMHTSLNDQDILPLSHPYNQNPWNYPGQENVSSLPGSAVDWVLVELREADGGPETATSGTKIAEKVTILKRDGFIESIDGSSKVSFPVKVTQNLYVVIYHRNHISVMSSAPLVNEDGFYYYDFTTGFDKAYGGSAGYKALANNKYGMAAGDGNADGQVQNQDKNEVWMGQAGTNGYRAGDFNMDGQVNNMDANGIWMLNSGMGTQSPDNSQSPDSQFSQMIK